MSARWFLVGVVVVVASCGSPPTIPTPPPPPPTVGPATAPVIQSITVPSSRVEVEQDVLITAVVTDAETPLNQLAYNWTVNVGTITGAGQTATWRHAAGLKQGADVVISVTIVDTYDAVVNNQIVKQEFRVVGQSSPFRVHDSVAELKELARKFLVDLFGNSSKGADDCLVDFSDQCSSGKSSEFKDIEDNRKLVEILRVTMFDQVVTLHSPTSATVISDTEFLDRWLADSHVAPNRRPFGVTAIYDRQRWWLCTSYVINNDGTVERAFQSYRRKGGKEIGIGK